MTFCQISIPFPEVKLEDFLRQAASGIISILTLQPSTTTPSLAVGYHVCNALVTLATRSICIEPISVPPPTINATSSRVEPPTSTQHTTVTAEVPRVEK